MKSKMIKRLLATRGVHYFVTRFGWRKLRSLAFDGKYERGDWNFQGDSRGELPELIQCYLKQGDLLVMGCGGASVLEGLGGSMYNSALGVDLSPEAIRLASRYATNKVAFKVSDMEAFECPRAYNVILFSESLYYVPAVRQLSLLKRLGRHLKSEGVFIVTLSEVSRYQDILERIRTHFEILEDRDFSGSSRHLIVFGASAASKKQLDAFAIKGNKAENNFRDM